MATFDFSGTLPQFKALIASAQLRNRYNDIKTHLNTFNPGGYTLPSGGSQYQALLLGAASAFTFNHVLRSNVALSHDDGNGSAGEVLQSDGDGTTSWLAFTGVTDGDKGDITVSSTGTVWTIDNDAITTVKILDANVTTAKIADLNVTTAKIADLNVTTAKIADVNVTTAKIADSNVTTAKINDKAVTQNKVDWNFATKTEAYTAVAGDYLLCDTATTAAFTVTFPASASAGDKIYINDSVGNFDQARLTIDPNSLNIESQATDVVLDIKNFTGLYYYVDATIGWKRI